MKLVSWALTAGLLSVASPGAAQTLWQNVSYGMSVDEVRRAQPGVEPYESSDALVTGALCQLRMIGHREGGADFNVCFYMLDGALQQVTLQAASPSLELFESFFALLRTRYDQAPNNERCPSPSYCSLTWDPRDSEVHVSMVFVQMPRVPVTLLVNYQKRAAGTGEGS